MTIDTLKWHQLRLMIEASGTLSKYISKAKSLGLFSSVVNFANGVCVSGPYCPYI